MLLYCVYFNGWPTCHPETGDPSGNGSEVHRNTPAPASPDG
jgi:hypothetical protein